MPPRPEKSISSHTQLAAEKESELKGLLGDKNYGQIQYHLSLMNKDESSTRIDEDIFNPKGETSRLMAHWLQSDTPITLITFNEKEKKEIAAIKEIKTIGQLYRSTETTFHELIRMRSAIREKLTPLFSPAINRHTAFNQAKIYTRTLQILNTAAFQKDIRKYEQNKKIYEQLYIELCTAFNLKNQEFNKEIEETEAQTRRLELVDYVCGEDLFRNAHPNQRESKDEVKALTDKDIRDFLKRVYEIAYHRITSILPAPFNIQQHLQPDFFDRQTRHLRVALVFAEAMTPYLKDINNPKSNLNLSDILENFKKAIKNIKESEERIAAKIAEEQRLELIEEEIRQATALEKPAPKTNKEEPIYRRAQIEQRRRAEIKIQPPVKKTTSPQIFRFYQPTHSVSLSSPSLIKTTSQISVIHEFFNMLDAMSTSWSTRRTPAEAQFIQNLKSHHEYYAACTNQTGITRTYSPTTKNLLAADNNFLPFIKLLLEEAARIIKDKIPGSGEWASASMLYKKRETIRNRHAILIYEKFYGNEKQLQHEWQTCPEKLLAGVKEICNEANRTTDKGLKARAKAIRERLINGHARAKQYITLQSHR